MPRDKGPRRVWVDTLAKKRATCPNCKAKFAKNADGSYIETWFGAYEYIHGKRHKIGEYCEHCIDQLLAIMDRFERENRREAEFVGLGRWRWTLPWFYRPSLATRKAMRELGLQTHFTTAAAWLVTADYMTERGKQIEGAEIRLHFTNVDSLRDGSRTCENCGIRYQGKCPVCSGG